MLSPGKVMTRVRRVLMNRADKPQPCSVPLYQCDLASSIKQSHEGEPISLHHGCGCGFLSEASFVSRMSQRYSKTSMFVSLNIPCVHTCALELESLPQLPNPRKLLALPKFPLVRKQLVPPPLASGFCCRPDHSAHGILKKCGELTLLPDSSTLSLKCRFSAGTRRKGG